MKPLNTSPVAMAFLEGFLRKVYPNLPSKNSANQLNPDLVAEMYQVNTLVRHKPIPAKPSCGPCLNNTLSTLYQIYNGYSNKN